MNVLGDASLQGSDANLEDQYTWHINNLELEALILSISHWQNRLKNAKVAISTGNIMVVWCLRNQGTIHSLLQQLFCFFPSGRSTGHSSPVHPRLPERSSECSILAAQGGSHRVEAFNLASLLSKHRPACHQSELPDPDSLWFQIYRPGLSMPSASLGKALEHSLFCHLGTLRRQVAIL